MAIINMFTLTVRGSTLVVRIDICRRQILTTKVDPHAVRVDFSYSSSILVGLISRTLVYYTLYNYAINR